MARLILKSPYLKPASKSRAANHLKYIATREGVVKPEDPKRQLPATQYQQAAIAELLKEYPDVAELYEHQDFLQSPTRANADEFIMRVAEIHGELFESRNKYVDYIATRPGAVHVAEHGLFSDVGAPIVLEDAAREVAEHTGNVWTHIISLRREDADRLGYNNVDDWMGLLRRQRNMIAKQMHIKPENFRWYAAFHDKEHHPHAHVMAWSSKPGEAWLSESGIEGIKSALARDIFQNDLVHIYQRQTQHRNALRQEGRTRAAEIVRQINAGGYENQAVQELLLKLAERLKGLSGKKVYGYLPADAKATVDRIVDELAKDERIAKLYSLWYDQREAVLATYRLEMPERIPLSQNSEFKSIKNAVIAEAAKLVMEQSVFPQEETPEPVDTKGKQQPNWEAIRLYRQAKTLLGTDPQEAVRLFTAAADQGYEWAQYTLGKLLFKGEVVSQDLPRAEQLLLAAEQPRPDPIRLGETAAGNEWAQLLLARLYLARVAPSYAEAERFLTLAAQQDNAYAQYALAKMHLNGTAQYSSVEQASRLLATAADQGYEWAQYQLGKMLLYGNGVERDIEAAVQLLTDSAAQGNTYAQALLDRWEKGQSQDSSAASSHLIGQLADLITTRIQQEPLPKDSRMAVESKLWQDIQAKKREQGLRM